MKSTENADSALLLQAYYAIAAKIEEATTTILEAAPLDGERQIQLQSKLMTAIMTHFLQTMPMLDAEDIAFIVKFAVDLSKDDSLQSQPILTAKPARELN